MSRSTWFLCFFSLLLGVFLTVVVEGEAMFWRPWYGSDVLAMALMVMLWETRFWKKRPQEKRRVFLTRGTPPDENSYRVVVAPNRVLACRAVAHADGVAVESVSLLEVPALVVEETGR